MKNKYKNLTQNTILFAISTFGAKIVVFFLLPMYTSVLSTEEYGVADLLTTTAAVVLPILSLNIQDAVLRFSLDKQFCSKQVIYTAMTLIFASCIPLALVLFGINYFKVINIESQYLVFIFIIYLANALYNSVSMYVRAIDKVYVFTIGGLLNTVFSCALNILFLLILKWGLLGYLCAYVGGAIIAVFYMYFASGLFKLSNIHGDYKILKKMLIYSSPLIFNSLAWWINNASDRYILTYFCGAGLNGIYSIAYKIPTILSTIQSVFYNAWSVSAITEFDKNDEDGFIGNVYTLYIALSIFLCSVIISMNIPLAKILYAKKFFSAWKYVPILLVGTLFNGLALFEGCLFTAVKQTRIISKTTILGAVLNIGFNILLIPNWGAYGAAIATLIGYVTIWLVRLIALKKIIKMKMDWKVLIIALIFLFIQCGLSELTNAFLLQVIIMLVIVIVIRKQLILVGKAMIKKCWRR